MSVTGLPLRRVLTAAGTGAAMLALGATGSAQAASAQLHYTCQVPLIGAQPLYVDIQAPTMPTSGTVGTPTAPFGITANAVTGGNTYAAITLTGTAKLADGAAGNAGTTSALVTQSDGSTIPVNVPVSIGTYTVPASAPLKLAATGTSPAVTPTVAGNAKVSVGDLNLNLKATKADGSVVALGSANDSDGDVNTFDMKCSPAAVGEPSSDANGGSLGNIATAQDTTLGTIAVSSPADNPPSAPGTPVASNITSSSVDLSWTASTDDHGVAGYVIYNGATQVGTSSGTSATISGLNPATSYTLTVKAKDTSNQLSAASGGVTFTTAGVPDTTAPSAPGTLSGTATSSSATLNWGASTDNVGVTGYDVYQNGSKVQSVAGTTATISGLSASTTYQFKVAAHDAAGNVSAFSNTLSLTTQAAPSNNLAIKFGLTGSTFLKGGNGSAALKGSIDASLDLTTGNFTADMALNPTVAHLKILGFLPVDANVNFSQASKTLGTFQNGVLSATAKVNIKIPSAKTFGITIAGGSSCGTATPASIPLKSGAGFSPVSGGTVSGTYTMPKIVNCGPLTSLLSYLTSVSGNTMNATLAPQS